MKKIILTLTGFCMLASVSVQAQGFEYEGLNYTSLTDSTAQVGLNSDVKGDIVIPDSVSFNGKRLKVTAIGENAFYTWFLSEGITSVVLPKGLVSIGNYAFYNQNRLSAIDIPETVEYLGIGALSHTSLKAIELKRTPKEMQFSVFSDCDSLERAVMPSDMKELPSGLFLRCKNLKEVVLPETMTAIGADAFQGCTSLESFRLPDSLKVIQGSAFWGCSKLKEIRWNKVVETLGDYLFDRCERLEEIAIPTTVTSLSEGCFQSCTGLRRITIPSTVTTISRKVFEDCTALEEVSWDGVTITSIPEGMFKNCKKLRHVDIPESVTRIGYNAFEGSGLQSVVFGPNLERIANDSFKDCSSLEEVYLRTDKLDELSNYYSYFPSVSCYFGTLYVPEGQKNKYMHLDVWNRFQNIVEENTSGTEYCLIDVKTNGYNTYVNDEEILLETHLEQPKGSLLTVRFTFDKNMFADGTTRYLRGMRVNGVERLQDCKDGTLVIDITEDLDIRVDIGSYTASLAFYQDERGGLEVLCERDNETNVIIMPAEGYRASISYGPWMKTYPYNNPWKESYTATDNQSKTIKMWPREDVEIKVKYEKK